MLRPPIGEKGTMQQEQARAAATEMSADSPQPAPAPPALVQRSITEPLREAPDYDTRMNGADKGLINAWEAGRIKAKEDPDTAAKAVAGELVVLPWKGGVERPTENRKPPARKIGTLLYLAMWQGLRGEDLSIDLLAESVLTCTFNGTRVTYTGDVSKFIIAE